MTNIISREEDGVVNKVPQIWHRVVVHFKNGKLVKGYTRDFKHASRVFSVALAQNSHKGSSIDIVDLKALFFVKTFAGDKNYFEKNRFEDINGSNLVGYKVKVEFPDGEIMRGTTPDYKKIFTGFYVKPLDPESNNKMVYVYTNAQLNISIGHLAEK